MLHLRNAPNSLILTYLHPELFNVDHFAPFVKVHQLNDDVTKTIFDLNLFKNFTNTLNRFIFIKK